MRSSVIKFLKMCKQFAEDYGSKIKNDENMIINTCYNNYKIILPNRTIKETIDLMKVIHQSAKDRFCVYLGKHKLDNKRIFVVSTTNSAFNIMTKYPDYSFTVVSDDFNDLDNDSFTFGYRYFVGFPLPEIYENVEL